MTSVQVGVAAYSVIKARIRQWFFFLCIRPLGFFPRHSLPFQSTAGNLENIPLGELEICSHLGSLWLFNALI